jgi:hypothetical protein
VVKKAFLDLTRQYIYIYIYIYIYVCVCVCVNAFKTLEVHVNEGKGILEFFLYFKANCANQSTQRNCLFIYLFITAIGLIPGGSSTVHVYTKTVHRILRWEHT